ncbi:RNA 2',3'-cyclic phosphodiesterase [Candidatus Woesearchaeota archaeon]|nr:RNA 2',3'-cyclic phosphodiesterase [Candidatus Woesearchaeota archaeon]
MRIFIAVELPERIKEKLKEVQKEFIRDGDINFSKEYHITLKFLGEISSTKIDRVKERLKTINFKPFDLHLSKLGVFPDMKFVQVFWVGVGPQSKIKKLHERIDSKLMDMFEADRKFIGHVTLGRIKRLRDKDSFLDKIREIEIEGSFSVKNFCLIQSELTSSGPIYTILKKYGL